MCLQSVLNNSDKLFIEQIKSLSEWQENNYENLFKYLLTKRIA